MSKKIFVGNLPFSVGDAELREIFSPYGELTEVTVIKDKYSGRSKGFGFITFAEDTSADKAISEMNSKEVEGRNISVDEAKPMTEERPRKRFSNRRF